MNTIKFGKMSLIGLSLLTVGLCVGCSKDERKTEENATAKRCWDGGGMPVRSIWDDRFIDCVYPKVKEHNIQIEGRVT